jgi:hypothetical protein
VLFEPSEADLGGERQCNSVNGAASGDRRVNPDLDQVLEATTVETDPIGRRELFVTADHSCAGSTWYPAILILGSRQISVGLVLD